MFGNILGNLTKLVTTPVKGVIKTIEDVADDPLEAPEAVMDNIQTTAEEALYRLENLFE